MKRREMLRWSAAATWATVVPTTWAQGAAVDPATRLVVADQSEQYRNLLEASGEKAKLKFDLKFPNFSGGPAILEAIRAGALDAAFVGDVPPIQARVSGTLLPVVLTLTRDVAEYRLVQRVGTGVKKLSDLKGKRVSYLEGSGRQAFLIEALNRGGVRLADVQRVPLRVPELNDALRAGAIDVAVLLEPHVTRLTNQGLIEAIPDPEERRLLPQTSHLYARPEVLADPQRAAALGQVIVSAVRAGKWQNANTEAWSRYYYQGFQRLSAEDARAITKAQSPLTFKTSVEATPHHQYLIDLMHQGGAIPRRLDAAGSFTDTFDAAIKAAR